ncbi:MAG: HAD-IB family hydrolase [Candidatus Accumulibacter sp.]|jgi:HAD superfamily hydrolase (TIGR01490 family)|nr:HAD-IB family hydrolase [Accumulibacter sp.]
MQLTLFDLDNTLLSGDSDYEWTRFLVDKGILDESFFEKRSAVFFEQYKAGTLDIDEFLEFQLRPLSESSRAELLAWHAEFMETRIRPMIGPTARALVEKHRGDVCALVTATNTFVTGPICRELKIPHLIATIAGIENGRFTGKARGTAAFREGKVLRVESWLESQGLTFADFERTRFYSDSFNDLPLLSAVGDPIAVNPDATLRAHATTSGWTILDFKA